MKATAMPRRNAGTSVTVRRSAGGTSVSPLAIANVRASSTARRASSTSCSRGQAVSPTAARVRRIRSPGSAGTGSPGNRRDHVAAASSAISARIRSIHPRARSSISPGAIAVPRAQRSVAAWSAGPSRQSAAGSSASSCRSAA
jgi:hypothetical protein